MLKKSIVIQCDIPLSAEYNGYKILRSFKKIFTQNQIKVSKSKNMKMHTFDQNTWSYLKMGKNYLRQKHNDFRSSDKGKSITFTEKFWADWCLA